MDLPEKKLKQLSSKNVKSISMGKQINFECKLEPDDDIKNIIKLVKSYNYPNVKFFQANKCEDKFGLNFKKINI